MIKPELTEQDIINLEAIPEVVDLYIKIHPEHLALKQNIVRALEEIYLGFYPGVPSMEEAKKIYAKYKVPFLNINL